MTDQALLDAVNALLMGALLVGFLGGLLGAAVASWLGSLSRWWLYRRGTGGAV